MRYSFFFRQTRMDNLFSDPMRLSGHLPEVSILKERLKRLNV